MEKKVKLLICYHKKAALFKDDILTPIHVGRANAKKNMDHNSENYKWLMNNMIGDDTGDNISELNGSYNEMTALYWAWKNYDALGNPDYIGLMHYRRHFVLNEGVGIVHNIQQFDEETYYDLINYSSDKLLELLDGCDFITHIGRVNNVYNHFIENQRKTDIDLANQIVLEKYPEYQSVMEEYYAGDESNFCNMNIFSRELFFEYCEWIFDILGEFEKRVDINEKRFFISERLTGLFVAKLMKNEKLKYRALPISFIDEPMTVSIAMPLYPENVLNVASFMTSVVTNTEHYHKFDFYIIKNSQIDESCIQHFYSIVENSDNCTLKFLECDTDIKAIPIILPHLLKKVNKCIYVNGNVIALHDLGEFFRICSTDDYYIVGLPKERYQPEELNKVVDDTLMVINCGRLRKHVSAKQVLSIDESDIKVDVLNDICAGEIGYIPWYFFESERKEDKGTRLFDSDKNRGRIQEETTWKQFVIYDETSPIENNQGIFSVFWWNTIKKLPLYFQNIQFNAVYLEQLYAAQQRQINLKKMLNDGSLQLNDDIERELYNKNSSDENNDRLDLPCEINEEWRNYGLFGKLKFYYKHNGFKKTVSYSFHKIFGRKNGNNIGEVNEEWRNYGFFGKLNFYYKHNGFKKTTSYVFYKMFGKSEDK